LRDISSGEFWDLFLAGCQDAPDRDLAVSADWRPLAVGDTRSILWSERATRSLARQITALHKPACLGTDDAWLPWEFTGPLELVAVAARRVRTRHEGDPIRAYVETVEIDWGSLRSAHLEPRDVPDAVTLYTQARRARVLVSPTGGQTGFNSLPLSSP